ncbi:MAG: EamA family transporter [Chloroflexi bacterium]|nr:EamA family transporter [Chloroflexota bacterium]
MITTVLSPTLRTHFLQSRFGRRLAGNVLTRRGLGLLVVLLSAAAFGAVTPFARLAYDDGVNVVTLMVVRYALAALAVSGYLAWRRQPWRLAGRRLWLTLGLALFMGLMSFSYLGSIRYIPVSLAALIYYIHPILVSLVAQVTGNEPWNSRERAAHAIAFGGQALSLGGLALLLGLSGSGINPMGVLMAAFSAVSITIVMVFGSRLMQAVPPMVLNLYIALANTALFTVTAVLGVGFAWPTAAIGWLGLMGVAFFFTAGFLGMFVGVKMIGPSRAACLSNVEPVVTIALAITVLHEPFSLWQFVGAAAVLVGIFTMCSNVVEEGDLYLAGAQESRG